MLPILANSVMLIFNRRDTTKPPGIKFRPVVRDICDTKTHKRRNGSDISSLLIKIGFFNFNFLF